MNYLQKLRTGFLTFTLANLSTTFLISQEVDIKEPIPTEEKVQGQVKREYNPASNFRFTNLSLYHALDQKGIGGDAKDDTYFEIEFGGRSGILVYYGYVDFVNVFGAKNNSFLTERKDDDNFFIKLAPKLSMNALLKKDLSLGPVKEWFISSNFILGDNALWQDLIGVGADVDVPWLGRTSLNFYARYLQEDFGSTAESEWDGFQISANWYKPFVKFKNGNSLTYQGYFDYVFDANKITKGNAIDEKKVQEGESFAKRSTTNFQTYQGVWYNRKKIKVGYGMKLYYNMNNFEDGGYNMAYGENDSSGIAHYFNVSYQF